ncbi:MAG: 50S ribosomal protein L21 [Candidatus Omnitrophota bacterium]|nr:50S ribosomal protein L21 [Candidatus Omnitrophota bacterium]
MYAIIEVGARQYTVKKEDAIEVEKQVGLPGEEVDLDKVLLISNEDEVQVGQPYLKTAKVKAVILKHLKAAKVISFKYRRRKASHWKKGHRQNLTKLQIKEIIS